MVKRRLLVRTNEEKAILNTTNARDLYSMHDSVQCPDHAPAWAPRNPGQPVERAIRTWEPKTVPSTYAVEYGTGVELTLEQKIHRPV